MIAQLIQIEQNTAILFGMVCAIISLCLLVALLADQIIRQNAALSEDDEVDHAMCVAHIADVVSDRFAAVVLRDLASRYDSTEEIRVINKIKREQWKPEGPVIPVLWLQHHADLLDPPKQD